MTQTGFLIRLVSRQWRTSLSALTTNTGATAATVNSSSQLSLNTFRMELLQKRSQFSTMTFALRKNIQIDDSEKVTYIDPHNRRHEVTFQELRRLVDEDKQQAKHNHNLIKIVAGGKAQKENVFKLMSATELEIAVRKARATHSHVAHEHIALDPSDEHADKSTRVKEKQLKVSANMSSHDMETAASRVSKWLQKGLYVRITVSHSKVNQKGAEEVVARIRDRSKEVLQDNEHLLNIKHV